MQLIILTAIVIFLTCISSAHAYIGPGMGGGLIAATIGVIVAIFAALFGILYFPIKRYVRERKNKKK